jgi:hypothetical protein
MIMCAVAIPLIAAGVGAAATIYSASKASSDAAAARDQTAQQMEQARKTAAQAPAASETSADVTAAVQANRKRAAAAYGMGNTITGAGDSYSGGGLGVGQKKQLGM